MEAFHKRVPVLAYAATAVPSTMDGGGVLYDTKSPAHVASLMAAILDDEDLVERILAVAGRRAGAARRPGLRRHAAPLRRRGARRAAGHGPAGAVRLLGSVRAAGTARGSQAVPAVRTAGARRSPSRASAPPAEPRTDAGDRGQPQPTSPGKGDSDVMLSVHQWVPAAHKGDAIGDSARRVRDLLRARGHASEIFALTIDDDLAARGPALRAIPRRGAATSPSSISRCPRR